MLECSKLWGGSGAPTVHSVTDVFAIRVLWALPATLVGLPLAALALAGGRIRVVDGAIEAHGPGLRWILSTCLPVRGVAAMTLGHIVIGCDARALEFSRAHERVHVRQYERWGPLFLPAYLAASAYAAFRGGHFYRDNCFEREAFAVTGPVASLTRSATSGSSRSSASRPG